MNPSPFSIGAIMAALGVLSPLLGRHQANFTFDTAAVVASVWLVAAGTALMLRRSIGFWIALGAGLYIAATGAWGVHARRLVGLPFEPLVSIAAGLYICFRVAMARRALGPAKPSVSIVDELDRDEKT